MILLQLDSASIGFGYILAFILILLISIFITRWIFRIDTMVHYLKIQADLLIKIAKYNKVPHDEIYEALGYSKKQVEKNFKKEETNVPQ
jgi:hypothetical protein